MSQLTLLTKRGFWPLFVLQFFEAMNDNIFHNAMVVIIVFTLIRSASNEAFYTLMGTVLFMLPFLLFSPFAGELADRFSKVKVVRIVKVIGVFLNLAVGLSFLHPQLHVLLVLLFCMGVHSTFLGPLKYAMLPENVAPDRLLGANGLIGGSTFIAILVGTLIGGLVISFDHGPEVLAAILVISGVLGLVCSYILPEKPAGNPKQVLHWNFFKAMGDTVKTTYANRSVFRAIMAASWFWLLGGAMLSLFPVIARHVMHGSMHVASAFFVVFSVGIACGSLLCDTLLKGKVSLHLTPWSLGFLSVFLILFVITAHCAAPHVGLMSWTAFWDTIQGKLTLLWMFLVALGSGVYMTPLYAAIQAKSDKKATGRALACNNVVNALFMVGSGLLIMLFNRMGVDASYLLIVLAVLSLVFAVIMYRVVSAAAR
jgi:acyl-[acyl-carrier-protein]-phospholipid O-acyltransferase/long-chain-fatty-acid--[acyl-carrier-protein] ligase